MMPLAADGALLRSAQELRTATQATEHRALETQRRVADLLERVAEAEAARDTAVHEARRLTLEMQRVESEQSEAVTRAQKSAELNEQLLGELDGITKDFHGFLNSSTKMVKSPSRT